MHTLRGMARSENQHSLYAMKNVDNYSALLLVGPCAGVDDGSIESVTVTSVGVNKEREELTGNRNTKQHLSVLQVSAKL